MSGKTTARKYINQRRTISGIDSDTLRTVTSALLPNLNVGHTVGVMANYTGMSPAIQAFIHARSFFEEPYILEGDCINLKDVYDGITTDSIASAVVLGYPNATVEQRMQIFKNLGAEHWSAGMDDRKLREKIREFIEFSAFLQTEARKYNLKYIDVSDFTDPLEVAKKVELDLLDQCTPKSC